MILFEKWLKQVVYQLTILIKKLHNNIILNDVMVVFLLGFKPFNY